ncbi:hypothetical protein SpCBS45565_g07470 [Spizellomyces sp. 'palustris']|nr:hypothetical protein SpCBS45565_g07470 [Spizellomyces sp. 'palustris']
MPEKDSLRTPSPPPPLPHLHTAAIHHTEHSHHLASHLTADQRHEHFIQERREMAKREVDKVEKKRKMMHEHRHENETENKV